MTEPFIVRRETHIPAPRATVFAYLADPDKIVNWMGTEAAMEPHPGGLYLLKGIGQRGGVARGAFREVVPVHRLAYTFGWEGGQEVPPGSSLIEIDLIERDGGTLLRMTHSGLPTAEQCEAHNNGWAHYLDRLSLVAGGRDPGPDVMKPANRM
ncbi:SRPBCC family protein [Bradyrhizobium iriomotense]|uniref:Transcriptional regulator n=1 Tax=Bradyrhizobium iriomotense TaxID=441950 RepID=A0ABQ6BAV6_9BRAD|nr:SRPBCC domain-containing protein [Bradyrhizobium iriomotense]GLR91492.1 transcriptional regulator [Bradyrhizobium iriomotense]